MTDGVATVLDALSHSDIDEARKKIEEIGREAKTERERGILAAARGIASSMAKGKSGTFQTWDPDKIIRAAEAIRRSEMSDEFDYGFSETLVSYARLLPKK
ncbi:MAG TPA: hypothetical protein VLY21_06910 [Nitrososphaerales archaeon]|nr:hypothetical protein [Nitrososphaerales archaeon]